MSFVPRIARLPGGLGLPFVEQGDPAGVPVLFLHGITDSWTSFEPVLPHLPERLHAFALTQRGHGDADKPETGYRPSDFASDVAAFLDLLGVAPAVVVGHSMGATVAQQLAIDHPDRVRALVLVSSFARFGDKPDMHELLRASSGLRDPIDSEFAAEFQRSTLARPIPQDQLEGFVRESLKVPARVWKAALEGLLMDEPQGRLGEIRAPTLVLWGERDALVPERDARTFVEQIPGVRLVVHRGAGHALHWEDPARFAAELTAFVDGLPDVPGQPVGLATIGGAVPARA